MPAKLTQDELDLITRTVLGEARGEGRKGMEAVAWVIRNRSESGRYSTNPAAVATQVNSKGVHQFSTWNTKANGGNNPENLSADSDEYRTALDIVQRVMAGEVEDPTQGATHYYSESIAEPTWFSSESPEGQVKIGRHVFGARTSASDARQVQPGRTLGPVDRETGTVGSPIASKVPNLRAEDLDDERLPDFYTTPDGEVIEFTDADGNPIGQAQVGIGDEGLGSLLGPKSFSPAVLNTVRGRTVAPGAGLTEAQLRAIRAAPTPVGARPSAPAAGLTPAQRNAIAAVPRAAAPVPLNTRTVQTVRVDSFGRPVLTTQQAAAVEAERLRTARTKGLSPARATTRGVDGLTTTTATTAARQAAEQEAQRRRTLEAARQNTTTADQAVAEARAEQRLQRAVDVRSDDAVRRTVTTYSTGRTMPRAGTVELPRGARPVAGDSIFMKERQGTNLGTMPKYAELEELRTGVRSIPFPDSKVGTMRLAPDYSPNPQAPGPTRNVVTSDQARRVQQAEQLEQRKKAALLAPTGAITGGVGVKAGGRGALGRAKRASDALDAPIEVVPELEEVLTVVQPARPVVVPKQVRQGPSWMQIAQAQIARQAAMRAMVLERSREGNNDLIEAAIAREQGRKGYQVTGRGGVLPTTAISGKRRRTYGDSTSYGSGGSIIG